MRLNLKPYLLQMPSCYSKIISVINMELPKRKPTRLKNYDYGSEGAYFMTIFTHNRKKIFSNIVGRGLAPAEIQLSEFGKIAINEILAL